MPMQVHPPAASNCCLVNNAAMQHLTAFHPMLQVRFGLSLKRSKPCTAQPLSLLHQPSLLTKRLSGLVHHVNHVLLYLLQGGLQAARGVVLFMHGFAQGPEAYYENLRGLADAGLLVVAPAPPFKPCRTELQVWQLWPLQCTIQYTIFVLY